MVKKCKYPILWMLYIIVWLANSYVMSKPSNDIFWLTQLVFVLFTVSWMFIGLGGFFKTFGAKFKEQANEEIQYYKIIGWRETQAQDSSDFSIVGLVLWALFFLLLIVSGVCFLINTY